MLIDPNLAFCIKYQYNVYIPSCLPRLKHKAPSCSNCQGRKEPILDCLTRESNEEDLTDIFRESKKESRHCDMPRCKKKHYQNGLCSDHYKGYMGTKGLCIYFDREMTRQACYQRRNNIKKDVGLEVNRYCIDCNGEEWKENK